MGQQQSGQEAVRNGAGENGGGFRAVVMGLICGWGRRWGQGICGGRWGSHNRIRRSGEYRKVTQSDSPVAEALGHPGGAVQWAVRRRVKAQKKGLSWRQ